MPLAAGFRLGIALRRVAYRRGWLKIRRLNRPVVSVGNITTGGTGKTPLVAYLARRLLAHGFRPGILTRGYGRTRGADIIVLEPSQERTANPREVGDEPALLAKMLPGVPIVVCRDRYRGGRLAEERFDVSVHLLDDAFQHWALERDVDIVTLDVTQKFSDRELLPAGRQREPCPALARADLIVLTRTELADTKAIESLVREVDPSAVLFSCRTELCELADIFTGRIYPPSAFEGEPVLALCGIGNPRAFFANLRKWRFSVVAEHSFRDHHVYTEEDLLHIILAPKETDIRAVVTTEKDAMNLAAFKGCRVPVLACRTEVILDGAEAFEAELLSRLETAREKNRFSGEIL
ncbi:MAG: tetraacyldisaccharide 4'-kinase [Acidobacteriia bacterium]|nr:tetraacyldisaccharide 4'-kinase [Terriglobia bacterium]